MFTESGAGHIDSGQVSEIIDSSALAKYITKEQDWEKIESFIASGDSLELAVKEVSNALWKKIRKKEIELEHGKQIIRTLSNSIWFLDQRKYYGRAMEIACRYQITIYDALFLACAEVENCSLVSSDKSQIEIAEKLRIKTIVV